MNVLRDQKPAPVAPPEVHRELLALLPRKSPQALVLSGVRRCGKSTLQAQLMKRHRAAAYINFEDTRLFGLTPEDFQTILSILDELAPKRPVFLDEVQEAPDWQRLVRALLDRGRTVCVTGSNASLLGRELGAKLTGRHLSFQVQPFSYAEYLKYIRGAPGLASLQAYLDDGGFPAYLRERNSQVLRELLRDVIQRDIAARYALRQTRHVMNLALYLQANSGQPFSLQSLTKSLAIPTVTQTARAVEHLEDACLLFAVQKFSASFRRRVVSPCKYYSVDNGLRRANSPQFSPDIGHRLENAVYLALRQRGHQVWYTGERGVWECDFLTQSEAIQVCAQLTPFNRARELDGLLHAVRLPGKRRPLILTLNQSDRLKESDATIEVAPAWKWLL